MAPRATTDKINRNNKQPSSSSSSLSSSSSTQLPGSGTGVLKTHQPNSTMLVGGAPLAAPNNNGSGAGIEDTVCSSKVTDATALAPATITADGDGTTANNMEDDLSVDFKRFLPAYKKPNAALTFPEKMMNLMNYANDMGQKEEHFCVSWLPDGKAFVIYDVKDFTNSVIPKFFKASKFCSFTRKLYRWGFRQLNRGVGPDEPIIFGNEFFQKDNADLMVNMRSITAASIRKRESNLLRHMLASKKRALISYGDGGGSGGAAAAAAAAAIQHQDLKPHERNLLLNNTFGGGAGVPPSQQQQQQKMAHHQNALAAAGGLNGGMYPPIPASNHRYGGLGMGLDGNVGAGAGAGMLPTNLSHMTNDQLQELYRTCAASAANVGMGAGGVGPVFSDALSQVGAGAGANLLPQFNNFNSGGLLPSYLPQDFNNALPSSLPGMHNGPLNNLINNSMFDINANNINGDFNGLNGNHLHTGMNFNGNQINNNPTFNSNNPSFPFNYGQNSANMLSSDLALFGNHNMNKQQPHSGNMNLNLHFQQNGTVKDAAGIHPTPINNSGGNGTNNVNHRNPPNHQVSAAAAAATAASATATGGPDLSMSMLYAQQQQ